MAGLTYDKNSDIPPKMMEMIRAKLSQRDGVWGAEKKQDCGAQPASAPEPIKRAKYGNTPTERICPNGKTIRFRSKKEASYYDYLMIRVEAGEVRDVRLEVQYLIKPAYTDGMTGERFRAVSYLADFVYEENADGKWIKHIIDTKGGGRRGTRTKEFELKRKLLADIGIFVEVVDS